MSGGQYDWAVDGAGRGLRSGDTAVAVGEQPFGAGGESDLASTAPDCLAHCLDHFGQAVGAYVGVGVDEYVGLCAMLAEYAQYAVAVATLFAAGI